MPEERPAAAPKQGFVARIDSTGFALGHPELWKFIKAIFAGMIGSVPELLSYMLLCSLFTKMQVSYLPRFFFFDLIISNMDDTAKYAPAVLVYAFIISTFIGQFIGFILARKVAFHANANVALSTFLKIVIILITIALNGIIGPAIVLLVSKLAFLPGTLVQIVSKLASMMACTAWVYPSDRFLVHRQVKNQVKNKKEGAANALPKD